MHYDRGTGGGRLRSRELAALDEYYTRIGGEKLIFTFAKLASACSFMRLPR